MCSPPSLRFPKRLFVPKVFYPGRSGATRIRPPERDDLGRLTSAILQHLPLVARLHRTPPARMPPTMFSRGPISQDLPSIPPALRGVGLRLCGLPRTPYRRSSENSSSTHSGE